MVIDGRSYQRPQCLCEDAVPCGYESGLLVLAGSNPRLSPVTLQHLGHRWYQPDTGRFVQNATRSASRVV